MHQNQLIKENKKELPESTISASSQTSGQFKTAVSGKFLFFALTCIIVTLIPVLVLCHLSKDEFVGR